MEAFQWEKKITVILFFYFSCISPLHYMILRLLVLKILEANFS